MSRRYITAIPNVMTVVVTDLVSGAKGTETVRIATTGLSGIAAVIVVDGMVGASDIDTGVVRTDDSVAFDCDIA